MKKPSSSTELALLRGPAAKVIAENYPRIRAARPGQRGAGPVQHARRNAIEPAAKVVITTIQRLYSMLKGEPESDEANEEQSMFESGRALAKEPLPVAYA